MASVIRVDQVTMAEDDEVCGEMLGLCGLEFDELEASFGCDGLEDRSLCQDCPLLVEDE